MTSVWKLFYHRRFRADRNAGVELGLDSSSLDRDPDLRHPRHRHGHDDRRRRHHLHHGEDRDPLPGDHHARHLCHRAVRTEHEPVQLAHSTSESGAGNDSNSGAAGSRISGSRLIRNDQLPSAVLQARARLLERLRGGSLAGSRQAPTASGIVWDEVATSDRFGVSEYADWEAETHWQWSESAVPYPEVAEQTDQAPSFHDASWKINWEAFHSLQREVFSNSGESERITRESLECCICLERFWEGDGLIRLHCMHRFHPTCLEPWVEATGTCPYCRASIAC